MMLAWCLTVLVAVSITEATQHTPAKVQFYSEGPGEFGKFNTLICHVTNFHPPDITIQLMEDGVELPNAKQTDLAFRRDWRFHLTRHVGFTPMDGKKYSCMVTHGTEVKEYAWESNM